ncbi:hypothetical protein B0T10DRAFT_530370 [Thelonectria olida]|uniref:Zn(2)-C6 fungal-type domain-containing protein n=1 Tax=Thelonectria olida TaxID=1576542 RepID=A0A9P8W3M6_9HYPO|nr:hypothetical protein B0T10DRAFT_530370 [Thelonectria olida]
MNVRHAACEPCRRAKLACGHQRPTCRRCQHQGRGDECVYRARPFRRRPNLSRESSSPRETPTSSHVPPLPLTPPTPLPNHTPSHRYPNPGFLGTSSHATIFNQVSSRAIPDATSSEPHDTQLRTPPSGLDILHDQRLANTAANTLSYVQQLSITKLHTLTQAWLDTGVSLPLAEPLVGRSCEAALSLRDWLANSHVSLVQKARTLGDNTRKRINLRRNTSVDDFFLQLLGSNLRWEMLGIFFTAATRAVLDTPSFTSLYANEDQRRLLVRSLIHISDCCLETCLALDCLNDLQLVLQYENMIANSQVAGDQSYYCWRKVGDVTSTLCALGYHEKIDEHASNIPPFIAELRRAAFARIFSADKSLAIFLGRPPRITKSYCHFQLPSNLPHVWQESISQDASSRVVGQLDSAEPISYTADTRCSALFAYLKEDVLQILRDSQTPSAREKSQLRDCHRNPFERDFLVAIRLDYLHTLFLVSLVSQKKTSEPEEALLTVAGEMLSLTVEAIILRDRLVNAGTSLIWKVAQYGLPAAGVVSLALLNSSASLAGTRLSRSKMVQDLSALVAEISIGAWIQEGEPNYALFTRATTTIRCLLDSLITWKPPQGSESSQSIERVNHIEEWDPYIHLQSWEFEMGFWASLAEHPTLIT